MSSLNIHINLDNDAFSGCAGDEVARILRELADKVEYDTLEGFGAHSLRDLNGNTVGHCEVQMDEAVDLSELAREARDKEFRAFVKNMSREDIATTLEHACSIQVYEHENRTQLAESLICCRHDGHTDLHSLRYFFQGKYQ